MKYNKTVALLSPILALGFAANIWADTLFSDNFDRPDSTVVGNGWSESASVYGSPLPDMIFLSGNRLQFAKNTPGVNRDAAVHRPFAHGCGIQISGNMEWVSGAPYAGVKLGINSDANEQAGNGLFIYMFRPSSSISFVNDGFLSAAPFVFTAAQYNFEWTISSDCSTELRLWETGQSRPTSPVGTSPATTLISRANPQFKIGTIGIGVPTYPDYDVRFDNILITTLTHASLYEGGDIIVGDLTTGSIIKVDPLSGAQTVISTGGSLVAPGGIAFDQNGDIILADLHALGGACPVGCGGVIRIDRTTGAQTVISSGGNFHNPFGIVVESNGNLVVSEEGGPNPGKILRVDPVTGVQQILSTASVFRDPQSLALDDQGYILVSEGSAGGGGFNGSVVVVDPLTGSDSILSGGGLLVSPWGIAIDQFDGIFLTEPGGKKIVRVDRSSGSQSLVSSSGIFIEPTGIDVDQNGDLLVADRTQIVKVDPVSGSQIVISSGGNLIRLSSLAIAPFDSSFLLDFPLEGGVSAYNVSVTAIMDHQSAPANIEDGEIVAFNGAKAVCEDGCFIIKKNGNKGLCVDKIEDFSCDQLEGKKSINGVFEYTLLPGSNLPNNMLAGDYLAYDSHSGYDFDSGTRILAATKGTMCALTSRTVKPKNSGIWRDENKCPIKIDIVNPSKGNNDGWKDSHTFYILHEDGMSTWYLHAGTKKGDDDTLEAGIFADLLSQGYADVDALQHVAFVGNRGAGTGKHLHFEVREIDGQTRRDPYSTPILWKVTE